MVVQPTNFKAEKGDAALSWWHLGWERGVEAPRLFQRPMMLNTNALPLQMEDQQLSFSRKVRSIVDLSSECSTRTTSAPKLNTVMMS